MSENKDFPYKWPLSEKGKKDVDTIVALLELDHSGTALRVVLELALAFARAHVKGNTNVIFSTPRRAAMIEDNPEFIEALCEEGVVEWLTPFVLPKSRQGGIAQSTLTSQPPTP